MMFKKVREDVCVYAKRHAKLLSRTLMIDSVKMTLRRGRMRSYFHLEEVNKYLNFINSISYKAEILSCWIGGRMHRINTFRIKVWVGDEIPSFF